MKSKPIHTKDRFGRLEVSAYSHTLPEKGRHWICLCDCGNEAIASTKKLNNGQIKSCGCLRIDKSRERLKILNSMGNKGNYKHGHASNGNVSPELNAYKNMINRCTRPTTNNYHRYGGRGIKVCNRWLEGFNNFLEDMGEKPEPKKDHSLERLDFDGNYEPFNCIWGLNKRQAWNRSVNIILTCPQCEFSDNVIAFKIGSNKGNESTIIDSPYDRKRKHSPCIRHGHTTSNTRSPEYLCWMSMMNRCFNSNTKDWKHYGGRGISVCDRWNGNFKAFYEDLGTRPSPKYSLDRIDVNGHYEPGNVRWATATEQQQNRRNNLMIICSSCDYSGLPDTFNPRTSQEVREKKSCHEGTNIRLSSNNH